MERDPASCRDWEYLSDSDKPKFIGYITIPVEDKLDAIRDILCIDRSGCLVNEICMHDFFYFTPKMRLIYTDKQIWRYRLAEPRDLLVPSNEGVFNG